MGLAGRAGRRPQSAGPTVVAIHAEQQQEAKRQFAAFTRVSDAAAVFRAHPQWRAPGAMRGAIRAVLTQEGFMWRERPQ